MQTYFIRHTIRLDVSQETREAIWDRRLIAIHYPEYVDGRRDEDVRSLDPEFHRRDGRNILRRFLALGRTGGFVCAEYHPFEGCIVGSVDAGTPVELFEGRWNTMPDRVAILKTIQLTRSRVVPTAAAAPIMVARPRQGTFCEWRKAGRAIERLAEGSISDPSFDDLAPSQQEVLCAEFIRSSLADDAGLPRMVHQLVPLGRTLRHVDIIGLAADGEAIYAQVTHSPLEQVGWKLAALAPYSSGYRILFCDADEPSWVDGVRIFPIRLAFEKFVNLPLGQRWLKGSVPTAVP